jgi:hypothetical protein
VTKPGGIVKPPLGKTTPVKTVGGRPNPPENVRREDPDETRARRTKAATEALETLSVALGAGALFLKKPKWQLHSMAVDIHAEPVGAGLAEYADKNRFAAMLIDRVGLITGMAGVATALIPLVGQIFVNEAAQINPDGSLSCPPVPPTLEQMGVLAADALYAQHKAKTELRIAEARVAMARETHAAQQRAAELQAEVGTMNVNGHPTMPANTSR